MMHYRNRAAYGPEINMLNELRYLLNNFFKTNLTFIHLAALNTFILF